MQYEPIFTEQDRQNIEILNNTNPDGSQSTQLTHTNEQDKQLSILLTKALNTTHKPKTKLTPIAFQYIVAVYLERSRTRKIITQVERGTIRGNALEVEKLFPPTIDNFCREAGISYSYFNDLSKRDEYKPYAELLKDGINSQILDLGMIGTIKENIAKFYLVNNSRFQDVSVVQQVNERGKLPEWMDPAIKNNIIPIGIDRDNIQEAETTE